MNINEDLVKNVINITKTPQRSSDINFNIDNNLLDITPINGGETYNKNGIDVTINSNGTILLNGTCTSGFNCVTYHPNLTVSDVWYKNIFISGTKTGNGDITMVMTPKSGSNIYSSNQNSTFLSGTKTLVWLGLYINAGAVCNNLLVCPTISKQQTVNSYQSYLPPSIFVNGLEIYNQNNTIVDSGSDTNGTYIKYGNGIMICYGQKAYLSGINITGQYEGVYYVNTGTISFPNTFKTKPTVTVTVCDCAASYTHYNGGSQLDGFSGFIWKVQSKSNTGYRLDWIAIGRWK